MSEVAVHNIKSFASAAQQADVSPTEESVFVVLTASGLADTLTRALQPLQDEISQLKGIVANLEAKVSATERTQDTQAENQLIQLRLINDLRKDREPRPLQRDRGEILRALIVANNGKMLAKEARQKMHLSRSAFSQLLATMKDDEIEVRQYHLKKNQKVLVLKSCLVKQ
jgi:hypothetical protein